MVRRVVGAREVVKRVDHGREEESGGVMEHNGQLSSYHLYSLIVECNNTRSLCKGRVSVQVTYRSIEPGDCDTTEYGSRD